MAKLPEDFRLPDEFEILEKEFEGGNPVAVDMAVIRALDTDRSIPSWAHRVLADRAARRIVREYRRLKSRKKEHPYAVMLKQYVARASNDPGGRGNSVADFVNRSFLVDAVEGARRLGVKGTETFDFAAFYLGKLGIPYAPASVKKLYYKWRGHFPQPEIDFVDFTAMEMLDRLAEFRKGDETSPG